MKTLVIIDVQNDFMPTGALPIASGDEVVAEINRVIDDYDLVVATQDWHPHAHKSFASSHQGKKPFDVIELGGIDQVMWPEHCVQGSLGADFHPALNTKPINAIFRKGMNPEVDSYSAFFDNQRIESTGLTGYLRERGATQLHFCGLAADVCVYFSINDAIEQGFKCTLLEKATRALDQDEFTRIKNELTAKGVILTS